VPPMMQLRDDLAREGLADLPPDILSVEEMVVALCR